MINIGQRARTAKFVLIACAQHVALLDICCGGCRRETGSAETFLRIFDTSVVIARRLAVVDAGFDGHACAVYIAWPGEKTAVGNLVVTSLGDVGADLLYRRGGHESREIVQTQSRAASAEFGFVAAAGYVAACLPYAGVILETVAAVAFPAVFDAGEAVVVGIAAAEGLAGFDGHAGGV